MQPASAPAQFPAHVQTRRDFFISYTQADRRWAEWIAWQLESRGITTVLQAWDFQPGGNFVADMQRAAQGTERTLVVLTDDYLKSEFCTLEWTAALSRGPGGESRQLVPVRIKECEPDGLLRPIAYIDLVGAIASGNEEAVVAELLNGLRPGRHKPAFKPDFPGAGNARRSVSPRAPFPVAPPGFEGPARPRGPSQQATAVGPRALTTSVLIACGPDDVEFAAALGAELELRGHRAIVNGTILFAEDQHEFADLDRTVCQSRAVAVVVSDTLIDLLDRRPDCTALAFDLLDARTSNVVAVCYGHESHRWAEARLISKIIDVESLDAAMVASSPGLVAKVAAHLNTDPSRERQMIGVPVVVVAMTSYEASRLLSGGKTTEPGLDSAMQGHLGSLRASLADDGLEALVTRYGLKSTDWKPFRDGDRTLRQIITEVLKVWNERSRGPHDTLLKAQYYPFDLHSEAAKTLLKRIYDELVEAGCVVVVDDVSMFYSEIDRACNAARLLTHGHVSLVTISPFVTVEPNPTRLLENELWSRFVFAFQKFESECDPQYEFDVADERRLRRWFHYSLPVAAQNLERLRPDPEKLTEFAQPAGEPVDIGPYGRYIFRK
jgi:TIR domain